MTRRIIIGVSLIGVAFVFQWFVTPGVARRARGVVRVVIPDGTKGVLRLRLDPTASQPLRTLDGALEFTISEVPIQPVNDIDNLWNARELTARYATGQQLVCAFGQPIDPDIDAFRLVGEAHSSGSKYAVIFVGTSKDYNSFLRTRPLE